MTINFSVVRLKAVLVAAGLENSTPFWNEILSNLSEVLYSDCENREKIALTMRQLSLFLLTIGAELASVVRSVDLKVDEYTRHAERPNFEYIMIIGPFSLDDAVDQCQATGGSLMRLRTQADHGLQFLETILLHAVFGEKSLAEFFKRPHCMEQRDVRRVLDFIFPDANGQNFDYFYTGMVEVAGEDTTEAEALAQSWFMPGEASNLFQRDSGGQWGWTNPIADQMVWDWNPNQPGTALL